MKAKFIRKDRHGNRFLEVPVRDVLRFRQKGNPIEADHEGYVDGKWLEGDDFEFYEALIASVRKHGVKKPIHLSRPGRLLQVMDGHHRLSAAWEAGLERVLVRIDNTVPDAVLGRLGWPAEAVAEDMTAKRKGTISGLLKQLREFAEEPWSTPDIRGMLRRKDEETTSANVGAYERPLGPMLRRTPSGLPSTRELLRKLYGIDMSDWEDESDESDE